MQFLLKYFGGFRRIFCYFGGKSDIKLYTLTCFPDCLLSNMQFLHVCKCLFLSVEERKQNRLKQEE